VYARGYDDGVNVEIGMVNVQDSDINININININMSFDVWEDRLLGSVDSIILEFCETVAGLLQDVIVIVLPSHKGREKWKPGWLLFEDRRIPIPKDSERIEV